MSSNQANTIADLGVATMREHKNSGDEVKLVKCTDETQMCSGGEKGSVHHGKFLRFVQDSPENYKLYRRGMF